MGFSGSPHGAGKLSHGATCRRSDAAPLVAAWGMRAGPGSGRAVRVPCQVGRSGGATTGRVVPRCGTRNTSTSRSLQHVVESPSSTVLHLVACPQDAFLLFVARWAAGDVSTTVMEGRSPDRKPGDSRTALMARPPAVDPCPQLHAGADPGPPGKLQIDAAPVRRRIRPRFNTCTEALPAVRSAAPTAHRPASPRRVPERPTAYRIPSVHVRHHEP